MFGKRINMDGILLLKKPRGITSYDVIRKIKPLLEKKQKIGHAGTLDPFAEGLMIIMLGKATKLFDELQKLKKTYRVIGEFGYETDTYDIMGTKVFESKKVVTEKELKRVLKNFIGEILQTPPLFSAKKIMGKRAYQLAREKKNFQLNAKKVRIYNLELIDFDYPKFELLVECSKGTYIRSLVVDIARELRTFATPVKLCREKIGPYCLSDAVDLNMVNLETDVHNFRL